MSTADSFTIYERYVNDPVHLPFCLFLMLVIFLSLVRLKEANGMRVGEAMVVTVVMLRFGCLCVVMLLASGMYEPNTCSTLVKWYRRDDVDEEDVEVS